eukprot:8134121-Alexandrium_andersonii.AAC.1
MAGAKRRLSPSTLEARRQPSRKLVVLRTSEVLGSSLFGEPPETDVVERRTSFGGKFARL